MRVFILFFWVLWAVIAGGNAMANPVAPTATHALLDLRQWDFFGDTETLSLDGEWDFAWQQLLEPQVASGYSAFRTVQVPHNWRGTDFGDSVSDGRGFGTYRLRILLPEQHPQLAVKVNGSTFAAAVFINGQLVQQIGTVGKNVAEEQPQSTNSVFQIPHGLDTKNELELLVHVSNFAHARGGMISGIEFGAADKILPPFARHQASLLVLVGGMLALMVYYLVLFSTRTDDLVPLYFSMFLLSLAVHMSTGSGVFAKTFPLFSSLASLRAEYLAVVCAAWFGYLFVSKMYPQVSNKWVSRFIYIYSMLAIISLFVLDSYTYTTYLAVYQAGMMVTIIALLASLIIAVFRRLTDAHILLAGLAIAFCAVTFGVILNRVAGAPIGLLVYLSFAAVVLSQAVALGRKMERSFRATKLLGQELSHANEQLEARVEKRTAQLNKALHQAKAASQSKSDFLAAMSHEIRTPMNGVIGMTQAVLDGELPPPQRENVNVIRQSAQSLMVILNDILDFSKIEAGKMTLEERAFAPQAVIEKALALWQKPIEQKGLQLKSKINGDLPAYLLGDETRLGQVLSNLLSNACKFTNKGHVQLLVKTGEKNGRAWLAFHVRDTGPGIDRFKVGQVFETFTQEDQSISRQYGGTGLGLSICKDLAELMGGTLKYDSAYEKGAAFVLKLEFKKTDAPAKQQQTPVAKSQKPAKRLNVLVAEDNAINRKVIRALLGKLPFDLSFAHTGVEAVSMAQTQPFDLVLMDIQMPEMGGIEAAKTIRASDGPNATTAIIATTANAMAGDREQYLAAGMDDFVSKPINVQVLITAIRNVMKNKSKPAQQQKRA
ncbi:BarA sensory histidine kinase (= VarS = GacS) [hydrothermal vent metagenome]|uniref:histidine kinase n=1 Tax=hydrothermal vent metagenome TaxID=652676 RepID=A0A3B0SBR6_9ZZZZ